MSLLACSSKTCRQWEIQEIVTNISCFNGGRLVLGPDSDYSYLELELIRNRSGMRFYINLLFLKALPYPEDPSRTRIEVLFEGQKPWVIYPYLLTGGQRLLLPSDIADRLIQALLEDQSFTIQIGRNLIGVTSDHFSLSYKQLLDLPIEEDLSDAISSPR